MLVNPDFSEVKDQVTPGIYKCRVRKGELKSWGEDKGSYINWELETFGETEPKNNGRVIFHKTSTSGKGAFMLQKFYTAVTGKALQGGFDTEELVSKEVLVEVAEGVDRRTGTPNGYTEVKNVKALRE